MHEHAVRDVISGRSTMSVLHRRDPEPGAGRRSRRGADRVWPARTRFTGLLHLGGPDALSRAELAIMIARRHGWDATKLRFSTIADSRPRSTRPCRARSTSGAPVHHGWDSRCDPGPADFDLDRSSGQAPVIVTSRITRLTPAARIGSQSRSPPTSTMSSSMRWSVEAIVNSRTGAPELTAADEQPGRPGREVAADRVHTRVDAGDALHEQTVVDVGDRAPPAICGPARATGPARPRRVCPENPPRDRVAGRDGAGSPSGVRVVRELPQHALPR